MKDKGKCDASVNGLGHLFFAFFFEKTECWAGRMRPRLKEVRNQARIAVAFLGDKAFWAG
jgi:hypothetical protein